MNAWIGICSLVTGESPCLPHSRNRMPRDSQIQVVLLRAGSGAVVIYWPTRRQSLLQARAPQQ